ncbi:MAG: hypothetical protein P4L85_22520 [Paludisphaera borealis]|uniref:hypothetical protein n=1 Tax=Paludisphaera borealis TaxID=1387353 RepID=UPI002850CD98|nr:hypothetical protein [Paludisphaera borealis]MDR3622142.1 hypothetical protein [Paludisphaera borealis]
MKKHHFVPGHVAILEERALLSGGFKFPAALGGSNTLGFKGALVLTSRAYNNVQSQINTAILNFNKNVLNLFNQQKGFTDAFNAKIGVGTYGTGATSYSYAQGTALAHLDARIASLEFKLPYGGGLGANNPTGGAGLSNRTALTTLNPGSSAESVGNLSVAELLDNAIANSTTQQELQSNLEQVRIQTLAGGNSTTTAGILPSYIAAFGPAGSHDFGTKNT